METLPHLPKYTWRVMQPEDADGLYQFELACSELDGATHLTSLTDWERRLDDPKYINLNSIVAADDTGRIAAAGWISYQEEYHEVLAFLDGRVHPTYRGGGIGGKLLNWLEARSTANMEAIADGRQLILRIMFYDRGEDAITLYKEHGYQFQYAEETLDYDLRGKLPHIPLPMGLAFYTWTPEAAADFYRAYLTSFSTRTDTPLDEESWVHHFANPEGEEFQQKISLLVKKDDLPLAFAVCHTGDPSDHDGSKTAWVTQMGVHADWRRQGIGVAILSELLHRFTKAGFGWASISVNINNPSAKALYEQVGFRRKDRFTMYLKEIEL